MKEETESTPHRAVQRMERHAFGRRAIGAAMLSAPALRSASAQTQAISLVVPYTAGGGTDIIARVFAPDFGRALDQTVVVDNRAGAAGYIGSVSVARARPDGSTLLFGLSTNVTVNPHLQRGDQLDLATALAPIAQVATYGYVLVADPDLGVRNVQELIALAKRRPGELTYSSSGVGGNSHLAGIVFSEAAGVQMEHVAYRGGGPAVLDVAAHRISINFNPPPLVIALVREGRLRALAVTGASRMPALPDVPTLSEAGLPGITITAWQGIFAPAATPAPMLDRFEGAAKRAASSPEFKARLAEEGMEPAPPLSRAAFGELVREENAFWARKVRELNIQLE